jgi:hypothetical protein
MLFNTLTEKRRKIMALGDIFKSKSDIEKEERKKRRKSFRDAEGAIDAVKDRIKAMKDERDRNWQEARACLKEGKKAAAQRSLQSVRASELMIDQLEKKRWVFEQLTTKLELAKTDQDFAAALNAINTVIKIDPDQVADVLDDVQEKLGEQLDIDKIWNKTHDKEMSGVEALSDSVPSVEDMMSMLNDEVAADVLGPKVVASNAESAGGSSVAEEIGLGRRRLNDLLEDGQ